MPGQEPFTTSQDICSLPGIGIEIFNDVFGGRELPEPRLKKAIEDLSELFDLRVFSPSGPRQIELFNRSNDLIGVAPVGTSQLNYVHTRTPLPSDARIVTVQAYLNGDGRIYYRIFRGGSRKDFNFRRVSRTDASCD